ncbi:AglZ/HisF2 family acetamidino modification protein [Kangiella sp.]|uniref:AglZ/HisF2 family acetamidino modification protein n=1 Tax=Kangiella sp. TaxID=1920245 RepID=UPI003A927F5A
MLEKRVIPTLLLSKGKLVKTVKFRDPMYIGDPINAVRIFNDKEVDELCLLDIAASKTNAKINFPLIESITREAFMPVCYGGGVKTIEDIDKLFALGIEKVALNNMLFKDKRLVVEAVRKYGSQSIVASIDVQKNIFGKYIIKRMSGTKSLAINLDQAIDYLHDVKVGEIYLTSINREGTMTGFDMNLVKSFSEKTKLPMIVNGGAGSCEDIAEVFRSTNITAVSCGSFFVYKGKHRAVLINYPKSKMLSYLGDI